MGDRKRSRDETESPEASRRGTPTQDLGKNQNDVNKRTRGAMKPDEALREAERRTRPAADNSKAQPSRGGVKKDNSGDDISESSKDSKKVDSALLDRLLHHDTEWMDPLITDFVDELAAEVAYSQHKQIRGGLSCFKCDEHFFEMNEREGCDVFGQQIKPATAENVSCVHCNRVLNASRFAPHLEKCMGLGRNSSRIASRKINFATLNEAQAGKAGEGGDPEIDHLDDADAGDENFEIEEDKDDGAWVAENKKKKTPPKDYTKKSGSVSAAQRFTK